MPDFLDRYGAQLHAAHRVAVAPTTATPSRWRRLPRGARRGILLAGCLAIVAAPAAAIVAPWSPEFGSDTPDGPVRSDSSPVHDNAVDTLAVLRREQTETDRSKAAPLLKAIGDQVDGVQTAGIRSLSPGWALVPVKRVYTGPDQVSNDELCITNGALIACAPAAATNATGVALITANPKATKFRGLVPDKVTSVRFVPADGRKPTMGAVTSNFYSLMVAGGADPGRVKAPPGYKGGDTIPGPPMPLQGRIEWLNESGEAVGPTSGAPTGRMRQPGGQLR